MVPYHPTDFQKDFFEGIYTILKKLHELEDKQLGPRLSQAPIKRLLDQMTEAYQGTVTQIPEVLVKSEASFQKAFMAYAVAVASVLDAPNPRFDHDLRTLNIKARSALTKFKNKLNEADVTVEVADSWEAAKRTAVEIWNNSIVFRIR